MLRSLLVIIVGYVINSSLVANAVDPGQKFVHGVAALTISLGFVFALLSGYLASGDTQKRRLKVALIIILTVLLGVLFVVFLPTSRERPNFQIIRFVAMLAGVGLGAYLKTPEVDDKSAPFGTDAEVRFKESNAYIRHIFDNLVRWFTFFVSVNYVSMGWFATSSSSPTNHPNHPMLPIISGLFAVQNLLGILMCLRVNDYIASAKFEIMENKAAGIGVAFPNEVYARAVHLMIWALLSILVVWLVFLFRPLLPEDLWTFV